MPNIQTTHATLALSALGRHDFHLGADRDGAGKGRHFAMPPRQRSARGRPSLGAVFMHPLGTDCTWQKELTGRRSSCCAKRGSRSSVRRSIGQGSLCNDNGAGLLSRFLAHLATSCCMLGGAFIQTYIAARCLLPHPPIC